jgi:hypothetical protein
MKPAGKLPMRSSTGKGLKWPAAQKLPKGSARSAIGEFPPFWFNLFSAFYQCLSIFAHMGNYGFPIWVALRRRYEQRTYENTGELYRGI